jgi:hypothetical protein
MVCSASWFLLPMMVISRRMSINLPVNPVSEFRNGGYVKDLEL